MLPQPSLVHWARWCKESFELKCPTPTYAASRHGEHQVTIPQGFLHGAKKHVLSTGTLSNTGRGHHSAPLSFSVRMLDSAISTSRKGALQLGMPAPLHFVLNYIQAVRSSYSNAMLLGVPGVRGMSLESRLSTLTFSFFLSPLAHTSGGFRTT